jgi:integrase
LCEEFLLRKVEVERRRPEKARQLIEGNIMAYFGRQLARDVTDRQIIALLDRIRESGTISKKTHTDKGAAPSVANHVLRLLKQIFRYGRSRRYLDRNPALDIGTDAAGGKEKPRTRALDQAELGKLLRAIPMAEIHQADALAIKIILATCVRVSELVYARWEHIDLDAGLWHVPGENTKTQEPIDIPLAPLVSGWFAELQRLACESAWVLPARRIQIERPNIQAQTLDRALRKIPHGLPYFVLHDLRRTARTQLAALGVSKEVAERCLNHLLKGVERIYNRHDYINERRDALEKWAAMLAKLEAGEVWNVVPLRA